MIILSHVDSLLYYHHSLVVGVSGGSDSMCLLSILRDFWVAQGRDLSLIHVAHYNHAVRKESYDEAQQLAQYCSDMTFHSEVYQGVGHSERDLRNARYDFFYRIMEIVQCDVLYLGHNLTDRIETSLMNMKRGCQIEGFSNMSVVEYSYFHTTTSCKQITLVRPLLMYDKHMIQHYCDDHSIPYVTDHTNFDATVSYRNYLRLNIVSHIDNLQLDCWRRLYDRIEQHQTHYDHPLRNDEMQGWSAGMIGYWELGYIARLFKWSGCYADMTQGRLVERQDRISHSFSGYKIVGGWKWWIKQKTVWIAKI